MAESQPSSFGPEEQSHFPQLTKPHGKSLRLTGAGEARLTKRLAELCTRQIPGLDVARILNEEFGLNWTFEAFFRRAQALNLGLPWISRARASGKKQSGPSARCVICRSTDYTPRDSRQKTCGREECQAALHVQHYPLPHPLTPQRKRQICLEAAAARDAKRDKRFPRWNGESSDTVRPNSEYENGPAFEKFVARFVICRVCGKLVQSIGGHLNSKKHVHPGIDLAVYKSRFPRAPLYSLKLKKRNRDWHNADNQTNPQRAAGFRANRKARIDLALQTAKQAAQILSEKEKELAQAERQLAQTEQLVRDLRAQRETAKHDAEKEKDLAMATRLPDDWRSKPRWWRTLGDFFLTSRGATNTEGAAHLDEVGAKRQRRRKDEPWVEAIKRRSVMNDFNHVRRWVGVPGMIASQKRAVNPLRQSR